MNRHGPKALGAVVVLASGLLVAACDNSTEPKTPTPAAVQATQGANATVEVAADLALAARVTDGGGGAVSGVAVQWAIVSGGGTLASASSTTDDAGTARVVWTVGTTVGAGEARASVSGVSSSASFPVTLTAGPATTVTLSADTARFTALDDTTTVAATAEDAYGNDAAGTIAWAVDDDGIATVSDAGLVTATGPGETFVTATSGAAVDTLVVLVSQTPVAVTVSPPSDTVASGDHLTLGAQATDANGHGIADAVFAWASSDTTVAAVDAGGVVEGRATGSAIIVATSGAMADSATVTVTTGSLAAVSVSPATVDLGALGDTTRLVAVARDAHGNPVSGVSVTWSSTDPAVATVDDSGLVTAVSNGGAGIVAVVGGMQDTAVVSVQQVAVQVTASPGLVALTAAGDTVRLDVTAVDANAYAVTGPVTWTSSSTNVASVSDGLVLAVADGTTEIVASMDAAADTVPVSVLTGAGVSRGWTGVGGSNWATPTSWTPAGRPNAADTTRILSGMAATPALNGNAAVGRLQVQPGAVLDLAGHTLEVTLDIVVDGTVTANAGKLLHSGVGSIRGNLPLVEITGTVEAVGPTTLDGGLRVLGGTLRTRGQTVTIQN